MLFDFHTLALGTAAAATLLAIGWLGFGGTMLMRWGLVPTTTDLMLGRRIGALYSGLALLFILARDAAPSELRTQLALAALVIVTQLGVLGAMAWARKQVGPGILVSVIIEIVLAVGYGGHLLGLA